MCFKQNRRFQSKGAHYDFRNKWTENMYHVNVNVNLILENIIQIKSGIVINVDASAKNIKCLKNIFGILLHVAAKIVNI